VSSRTDSPILDVLQSTGWSIYEPPAGPKKRKAGG
jgi:hypothetical protein